jgi:hypothetical protein
MNAYRIMVEKPEGKRPIGRPRYMRKDNIKVDIIEIGLGVVNWIQLAQDRDHWRIVVNTVINLSVQ